MIYYLNLNATPNVANDGTEGSPWALFSEVGQNQTLVETDVVKVSQGFYDVSADANIIGGVIYYGDGLVELDFGSLRLRSTASFADVKTEFNNFIFKNIKGVSGANDTAVDLGLANASSDVIFRACKFKNLQTANEDQTALFGSTSAGGFCITLNSLQIIGCELDVTFNVAPTQPYRSNGIFAVHNTTIKNTTIVVNGNSPVPISGGNFIFGVGGYGAWSHTSTVGCSLINTVVHGNGRMHKQYGNGGTTAAGGAFGTISNYGNWGDPIYVYGCTFWDLIDFEQSFTINNITGIGTTAMRIWSIDHAAQQAGDIITVKDVVGPTGVNKSYTVITNYGSYIQVDGTGTSGTYTSGGTIVPDPNKEVYVDPKMIDLNNVNFDFLYNSPIIQASLTLTIPADSVYVQEGAATGGDGSITSPYGWDDATERLQAFQDAQLTSAKTIAFDDGTYDIGTTKIQYTELDGVTLQSRNKWGAILTDSSTRLTSVAGGSTYKIKNCHVQPRDSIYYYAVSDDYITFEGCLIKGFDDTDVLDFQFGAQTEFIGCTIFGPVSTHGIRVSANCVRVLGCTIVCRGSNAISISNIGVSTPIRASLFIKLSPSTSPTPTLYSVNLDNTNLIDDTYTTDLGTARQAKIRVLDETVDNIDVIPNDAYLAVAPEILADHWFAPTGQGLGTGANREDAQAFSQSNLDAAYDTVGNNSTIAFRGDLGDYVLPQTITFNNAVSEYSNVTVIGENGTVFDGDLSFHLKHRTNHTMPANYENFKYVKAGGLAQRDGAFRTSTTSAINPLMKFTNVDIFDWNGVLSSAFGYIGGGLYFNYELNGCNISNVVDGGSQDYLVFGDETYGAVEFVANNCVFHAKAGSVAGANYAFFRSQVAAGHSIILNNCICSTDVTGFKFMIGDSTETVNGGIFDKTSIVTTGINLSFDGNELDARPRYTDVYNNNFELLPTSPNGI